jgi:hypothetical protein|tara:strand:- start:311 stop:418 length:108 start_codon:yes stop_codon:yes gene_type:complete
MEVNDEGAPFFPFDFGKEDDAVEKQIIPARNFVMI